MYNLMDINGKKKEWKKWGLKIWTTKVELMGNICRDSLMGGKKEKERKKKKELPSQGLDS